MFKFLAFIVIVFIVPVFLAIVLARKRSSFSTPVPKDVLLSDRMINGKFHSSSSKFYELEGTSKIYNENKMTSNNKRTLSPKLIEALS